MRAITDINELRNIQMDILQTVHDYCQSHGMTYFLSSGTLLGAVRHGGYIPWDDDIDIYMPRESYDRFVAAFPHDDTGHYALYDKSTIAHYYYTFAKVVDTRTLMVEDETAGFEIGVYIDVFPVDYVPEDEAECQRVFKRKRLLYKIRRCKISHVNPLYSRLAYWCYRALPVSVGKIEAMLRKLIVHDKPTSLVCNMSESGPKISGCFPAAAIEQDVDIEFEGRTFKTMVGYKTYLEKTYGDYMTLPPVEQRVHHHFEAYWRE